MPALCDWDAGAEMNKVALTTDQPSDVPCLLSHPGSTTHTSRHIPIVN